MDLESRTCSSCKNCAICVNLLLPQYNLLTDAYHVIGLAYKFLLTLSITQVACERSFSTLTFVCVCVLCWGGWVCVCVCVCVYPVPCALCQGADETNMHSNYRQFG